MIGLFVAFLFQLEPGHDNVKRSPPPPKPANTAAKPAPAQQPTYDFYTLLPESEVVVPQNTGKVEAPPSTDDTSAGDDQVRYYLQAGSFKQQADADKVRAQILLLGMDVHLESAKLNDGQTWHRVQVGPFKDKSSLTQAQSTLSGNGFHNLLPQQRTQ